MKQTTTFITTIILAIALNTTFSLAADTATGTAQAPPKPRSITVKQALTQPADFTDQRVLLAGKFMGYKGNCPGKRPVDISDTMIQDKQGLCIFASGPLPEGYDPDKNLRIGDPIVLSGYVKKPKKGAPYFLIPDTGKNKRKGTPPAAKLINSDRDKKGIPLTLEQLLAAPDKYVGANISLNALYMADKGACQKPAPDSAGQPAWMLHTADSRCIWAAGPTPDVIKDPAADINKIVTVKGTLNKSGDKFMFIRAKPQPDDKAAPPK